jgi:hypothetical protein
MCIFSGPISHVSGTNIMLSTVMQSKVVTIRDKYGVARRVRRPSENTKPLQLTVYSNTIAINHAASTDQTAMILPFPLVKGKNRVQVMDLSKCKSLFKRLGKLFKSKHKDVMTLDDATDYFANGSIPVQQVGSYLTSIVPNFDAFDKLQYNQFGLSPEVKELLKQYYSKKYGFIVCILKKNAEYHPFGYTHEIRPDGKLFVPTRHFHGHTNESQLLNTDSQTRMPGEYYDEGIEDVESFMARTMSDADPYLQHAIKRTTLNTHRDAPDVDWDHSIYIMNYSRVLNDERFKKPYMEAKNADPGRLYKIDKYFDTTDFPNSIIFPKIKSFQRLNVYPGYSGNHDLLV